MVCLRTPESLRADGGRVSLLVLALALVYPTLAAVGTALKGTVKSSRRLLTDLVILAKNTQTTKHA